MNSNNELDTFVNEEELQEMFDHLDCLRDSGQINMFGGAMSLREEFPELSKHESRKVLKAWADTFDEDLDVWERTAKAIGRTA